MGAEQNRWADALGNGVMERPHLLGCRDVRTLLAHPGRRTPRAWVSREESVVALRVWQERIAEHVGHHDEQTGYLAKYLDELQRTGVNAERILELTVTREPLPVDHPTAALAYRVRDLATPGRRRASQAPSMDKLSRPSQQPSGFRAGAVDRRKPQRGRYDEDMSKTAAPARKPLSGPTGRRVAACRAELLEVLRRHGVTNPEIFGSAARGDDREGSDVDLLVDFPPGTSIIDIIGIQHELEDLLGVPVDLVPRSGLKERVRSRAAKDLLPL